ncbi:Type III site-specific deoxyribonuclease [Thermincola potens JR]|uniref:Type III site-specific deoxyribonuclease n=2 Tax=Thermincola TaxID=278993 RepID=D5XE67_THEPJ|nr:Type III site-specific deoxyribonuclease [Thermincola potens JR]
MMKLKFKHQQFQIDAVNAVVDCFAGQPNTVSKYTLDRGNRPFTAQMEIEAFTDRYSDAVGFKNKELMITDQDVLANIQKVQKRNGLKVSEKLEGRYNLTIEMETGTGKTYTYIRTMFELNKKYGWSKFIVVVPSIAIREGVYKSFQITEDHFINDYGIKARYFIYNSKQLHNIESFASDAGINVMIINSQAFNARGKDARRIYMELDDFQSRRPIDVIAQTNPILIIDEPQSVEGERTKEALKAFNPLFTLRYSATHRQEYNKIYRLDALDAYNKKLVKKIQVKGISVKGSTGTEGYLYLEGIDVSSKKPPIARIEFEKKTGAGIKKVPLKVNAGDDLYQLSGGLEQYRGYVVSEVNGYKNTVSFLNGLTLSAGDVQGDIHDLTFRRIQIRETIVSHFEKEKYLFHKGIKVLSLFFIDEVAKYRKYDRDGTALNGEYAQIFEEEYTRILNEYLSLFNDDPYIKYLQGISVKDTHKGYFSIDKKTNRLVNSKVSARETESDDVDAYDLIMKDKERLLSFEEPTRFIFSHSALREGWDNPNVFQICTLKHSDSTIKKRQEVGRGLRLCVNMHGERIDSSIPGIDVHDINVLTVVASESYEQFARQLQAEIAETLADRPHKADVQFFLDRAVTNERGETIRIDEHLAKKLNKFFYKKDYIDEDDNLTQNYFTAVETDSVEVPEEFNNHVEAVVELLKEIYSPDKTSLVSDERKGNVKELKPNDNFYKKEFQDLWNIINRKTAYTVRFDSDELVKKCIEAIDQKLAVPDIQFRVKYGEMTKIDSRDRLKKGEAFEVKESYGGIVYNYAVSQHKYDLIGKLVDETRLTRKTIVRILTGISPAKFALYRKNPEQFIINTARIINEQKATTIIEHITYDVVNDTFDTSIFTLNNMKGNLGSDAIEAKKHIYDFVLTDSKVEKQFARELDTGREVCVFAKLPRGFFIPTPVGDYNPDWAIVFNEGDVKHIYFVAETKGSMDSLELREVEKAKIYCARKHFESISTGNVKYEVVNSYEKLLEIVK